MAGPVTLAQLRTRVRQRADMENSQFVTDAELATFINASADFLYDILVGAFEDRYVAEAEGNTSSLTADGDLAIPANMHRLRGVDMETGGYWHELQRFEWRERNSLRNLRGLSPEGTRYALRGDTIRLLPAPPAGLPLVVSYVPTRTPLALDTDTIDGVSGWEEWVVVDAARKCLMKEESDTTALERELAALDTRIKLASSRRDNAQPARVVDVTSGEDW